MKDLNKTIKEQATSISAILAIFFFPFVLLKAYGVVRTLYPALPVLGYWAFFWLRWGVVVIRRSVFGK